MLNMPIPEDWGKDSLSEFMSFTIDNTFHTFVYDKTWFDKLRQVHDIFWEIVQNLDNTEHLLPPFFIFRAHSAYLAGVRLALSGQLAEAYMCLRGCLENAFYSFHIHKCEKDSIVYLCRDDDQQKLKEFKKIFRPSAFLDELEEADKQTAVCARELYERAIEYGAHPNPKGMLTSMEIKQKDKRIQYTFQYLLEDKLARGVCMKTAAQTGVCALHIFRLMLEIRFNSLGITDKLLRVCQEL